MSRRLDDFEPVPFRRHEWPCYDVYPADRRSRTLGLSVDALAVYLVLPDAAWEIGDGWRLKIPWTQWRLVAPFDDQTRSRWAFTELSSRDLIVWDEADGVLTIGIVFLHAYLARRDANRRKGLRRLDPRPGVDSPVHSRACAADNSRVSPADCDGVNSSARAADNCQPTATAPAAAPSPAPAVVDPSASPDGDARPAAPEPSGASGDVEAIVRHYQRYHPKARPGAKERRLIAARLADGYALAELCQAIDGCHRSPHHCGQNPTGTKYQNLELIVRDSTHVQQFIEASTTTPDAIKTDRQRATEDVSRRFLDRFGVSPDGQEHRDDPQ